MSVNVALIGLGYWGPNLARSVSSVCGGRLHTICELRPERLTQFRSQYPNARTTLQYRSVLDDREVDAVIIATPAQTHFELTRDVLLAGKHVMVEKPLAKTVAQCRELIALAEKHQLVLMSAHVFMYNAAVRKVKEYIESGLLGRVYYIYSQRLNLGVVRNDVNALWNLGPHDLSIINYWLGTSPSRVTARGYDYIQPGIQDVVFMTLDYPANVAANVHISWLDPHKVRRMTIVGSEKMVVYDDVSAEARVMIYDKGISKQLHTSASAEQPHTSLGEYATFGEFQLLVRAGDVIIPKLEFVEPLKLECQHFVDCVSTGRQPLTDGYDGLRVVEALEAAQASLAQEGAGIQIRSAGVTPRLAAPIS